MVKNYRKSLPRVDNTRTGFFLRFVQKQFTKYMEIGPTEGQISLEAVYATKETHEEEKWSCRAIAYQLYSVLIAGIPLSFSLDLLVNDIQDCVSVERSVRKQKGLKRYPISKHEDH